MSGIAVFTDVSLDPRLHSGMGACLCIPVPLLVGEPREIDEAVVPDKIMLKEFDHTSSTKLEVQTVLWALEDCCRKPDGRIPGKIRLYTDSQCVAGLLKRRPKLEAAGFLSRRTKRPLNNALLYRRFYELYDELGFEVIKVAGHTPRGSRDTVHRIFSLVDRYVRRALSQRMARDRI